MRKYRYAQRPNNPLEIHFSTWIHESMRVPMVEWAVENLSPDTIIHSAGHTWTFVSEEERDRFIAHRPMSSRKILTPNYFTSPLTGSPVKAFPFKVAGWVTVLSTIHAKLDPDEENRMDWFWIHIDEWIVEHCRQRVGWTHTHPNPPAGHRAVNNYTQHYGFESAEEAVLFRLRWN